ncbi:hypothetical protein RCL1_007757 [Eukaryota sp. TZLM3-RCL]
MSTRLTLQQLNELKPSIPKAFEVFAVVKLYQSHHGAWLSTGVVGALLVSSHSIALLSFPQYEIVLEQPFYSDFQYMDSSPLFHSFEGDSCVFGFLFANETDASRSFQRIKDASSVKAKSPDHQKSKSLLGSFKSMFSKPKEEVQVVVSKPSGFKRTHHIGLDADGNYQVEGLPKEWLSVLNHQFGIEIRNAEEEKIARRVIKKELKKKQAKQHDNDPVQKSKPAPPAGKAAPPLPTPGLPPPPLPTPGTAPPPLPLPTAGAPKPKAKAAPKPAPEPKPSDGRSDLLAQIRNRPSLKPTVTVEKGNLNGGAAKSKPNLPSIASMNATESASLQHALAVALANRRSGIVGDNDSSDSDW